MFIFSHPAGQVTKVYQKSWLDGPLYIESRPFEFEPFTNLLQIAERLKVS